LPVDTLILETGSASDQGPDTTETLLEFPDNRLLIDLCGEYDRNLSHIENALSLQIIRRGNRLALIGDVDTSARAAQVLGGLYMRLEAGGEVDIGEIDGALRLSAPVFDPAKDGAEEKPATAAGGMTWRANRDVQKVVMLRSPPVRNWSNHARKPRKIMCGRFSKMSCALVSAPPGRAKRIWLSLLR
jgi:hypothetical protein